MYQHERPCGVYLFLFAARSENVFVNMILNSFLPFFFFIKERNFLENVSVIQSLVLIRFLKINCIL